MNKKVILIVAVALVVITVLAGVVITGQAAAKNPELLRRFRKPRAAVGQLETATADMITITRRDGEQVSYALDEMTHIRDRQGSSLTLADLERAGWVVVVTPRAGQDEGTARLVIVLPDDFDPDTLVHARGVIQGVDEGAGTIRLKTRLGEELTFEYGPDTLFKGQALDPAGLAAGMWARINSQQLDGGGLSANLVRSTDPLRKLIGEFTAIDQASQTLTILTRLGDQQVTVSLDDNTRVRSRDEAIASPQDLEPGMSVLVIAKSDPDSSELRAAVLFASRPEDLPDRRVFGELISVGGSSITVQAHDGRQYVFQVSEDTRYRSRDGQLDGMEDLQAGMNVFVSGKELGSAGYTALVIARLQLPSP